MTKRTARSINIEVINFGEGRVGFEIQIQRVPCDNLYPGIMSGLATVHRYPVTTISRLRRVTAMQIAFVRLKSSI